MTLIIGELIIVEKDKLIIDEPFILENDNSFVIRDMAPYVNTPYRIRIAAEEKCSSVPEIVYIFYEDLEALSAKVLKPRRIQRIFINRAGYTFIKGFRQHIIGFPFFVIKMTILPLLLVYPSKI